MQQEASPEHPFWGSERYFRLLVESAKEYAIFSMDVDGRITTWNPGAERLLGWRKDEVIGRDGSIIFTKAAVETGVPEREMEIALQQGHADDTRWHVRKEGRRIWVNAALEKVENEAGEVIGFAKILRDLTEVKQYRDALERSNERLQAFTSYVAHEVRSPLVGVRLHLDLLFKKYGDVLDAETLELAREAEGALQDLDQFVGDMLAYARLEGLREVALEPTQSEAVLNEALADLRPEIQEQGAKVVSGDLPLVYANPTQLRHLLRNLISNGIKYNDSETPRVEVEAERRGDLWRFSVRDNGIGMSDEEQASLFRPFQRSAESEQPGVGVGLVLSKQIIEQHGGSIWFESAPGRGTTCFFTLRTLPEEEQDTKGDERE